MSSGCGDVLTLEDLKTAKKHQIFEAEVITGKSGGVAGGADIDYATNPVTGQVQKTMPAVLRDLGFDPAPFDFTTGGTLSVNDRNKVVFDPVSQTWYSWAGALPKVIPAGTDPTADANWKPQTDPNLRDDLESPTGVPFVHPSNILALPQGSLAQNYTYVTPEQYGAVGGAVAEDITAFRDACLSGYNVKCRKGVRYKLSMTEANVITLPAGVDVDLNGATLVVPNTGFLVFLLKNKRCSVRNGYIEYQGSYPTTAAPTTRYGISRPHEAAFCGFIGLNTTAAQDVLIDNLEVYGATDTNLYDFVVSGYEGSFTGTRITRIRASHYACMIINNMHGTHMRGLFGTKRHNKSSVVYGPSHLAYVGMHGGSLRDVYETGNLLSNESTLGYAGATVQTTGINGAVIDNINTTMTDVGALSVKLDGIGFSISNVYSKSAATFSQPQALVEIQTNLQASIQDGFISNVRAYLPVGNLGCVGYRHGGSRVKARNIYVDVPYTDAARTSEVAFLITSDYPDVELDIRSSKLDSKVLLSSFNQGRLTVNNLNNAISITSGTSINGSGWGENTGTEVSIQDNPTAASLSSIDVSAETRRKCIFNFAGWFRGDFYRNIINQSSSTTLVTTIPVRVPPATVSSEDHNVLVYEVEIMASSIAGAQAVASKHYVYLMGGASSVTGTTKDIAVTQLGSIAILPTINYTSSLLTVTVTRQSGGENLRDLVVRSRLLNNRPHV